MRLRDEPTKPNYGRPSRRKYILSPTSTPLSLTKQNASIADRILNEVTTIVRRRIILELVPSNKEVRRIIESRIASRVASRASSRTVGSRVSSTSSGSGDSSGGARRSSRRRG